MENLFFGSKFSLHLQNPTRKSTGKMILLTNFFVQLSLHETKLFSCLLVETLSERKQITLENSKAEFRKELEDHFISFFGFEKWNEIARSITLPPAWTCIRLSSSPYSVEETLKRLNDELKLRGCKETAELIPNFPHCARLAFSKSIIDDNLLLLAKQRIIVDTKCGEAVLRGADIFAPGIRGASSIINENDLVSIYVDLDNVILNGDKDVDESTGYKRFLFLGIGKAIQNRKQLFLLHRSGVAVEMISRVTGDSPPLNNCMDGEIFIQNFPSSLTSVVLDPQPNEVILDMCASPGGKTSHIQSLMKDTGILIACDRSVVKCLPVRECCEKFAKKRQIMLDCIRICKADSSKPCISIEDYSNLNLSSENRKEKLLCYFQNIPTEKGIYLLTPGTLPKGIFDRILLDGPCSSLGVRPRFSHIDATNKVLREISDIQKRMLSNAIQLVKVNGFIVYSTCTFNPGENEEVIKWALERFPDRIKLVPSYPRFGQPGLNGILNEQDSNLVQRFDPSDGKLDTIGFFIAKLQRIS